MYVIKDRIETIANVIFNPHILKLKPGRSSPDNNRDVVAKGYYIIVPNLDYDQPYIHTDAMQVTLFHTNYLQFNMVLTAIIRDLNQENPHQNVELYTAAKDEGYLLKDVVAAVGRVESDDFIDGTTYFVATINILASYTRMPSENTHPVYIRS